MTARLVHAEEAKQLQTDLVSAGVEEVAQTHDVAVVQLSHDLQLAVLEDKKGRKEKHSRLVLHSGFMVRQVNHPSINSLLLSLISSSNV